MTQDTKELLIVLPSILFIVALVWAWFSYFPKAVFSPFRIKEKKVGKFQYYQAQVLRPVFGWSAFYASTSDGTISRVGGWERDRSDAERQIRNYQDLKS